MFDESKKKFLLHSCCAPCSVAIIDELKDQFDLTVFFYNPNIFPLEEYLKRKTEVMRVCGDCKVPVVDMDYEADQWHGKVAEGLENVEEGGERCSLCFRFRLAKSAEYAAKNSFEFFGSSLTSGRNKKAEVINPIGQEFAKLYKINFFDVDWKTGGRQEKGSRIASTKNIYRQNYCGCKFSLPKNI
ncbi:epoxyqueuosine reductase QueH [Patescibacteria group bacterium]|nr:epoxyqueuosine reductase QueH [Patescibacteria group bacterium]MBU1612927.1 epoxyqueuosine reductase QueH [Patescibacteria group bacterium]